MLRQLSLASHKTLAFQIYQKENQYIEEEVPLQPVGGLLLHRLNARLLSSTFSCECFLQK